MSERDFKIRIESEYFTYTTATAHYFEVDKKHLLKIMGSILKALIRDEEE